MTNAPVLVVGAGPVGLVLTAELRRAGVDVRLVDSLTEPSPISRAVAVHSRSLEMLRAMGVVDRFVERGVRCAHVILRTGAQPLADVGFDEVETAFPYVLCLPQDETERLLAGLLEELGGRVERGVECVGLESREDGVTASLRHSGGRLESLDASFLVGCDGARSTVRRLAGTKLEGSFQGAPFLLADCEADGRRDRDRISLVFSPSGLWSSFPLAGDRCRLVLQLDELPPGGTEPTLEQLQRLTDERAGAGIRLRDPHWLAYFEVHHGQVPRYRIGRVLLAGDAAHIHSPAGGQGMNTGMQDAYNLAWKLALAWHGQAAPGLLESYHAERHPVAAGVVKMSSAMTRLGTVQNPVGRRVRELGAWVLGRTPAAGSFARRLSEIEIAYRESPIVATDVGALRVRPGALAPDVEGLGGVTGGRLADAFAPAAHTAVHLPVGVDGDEACSAAVHTLRARFDRRIRHVVVSPDGSARDAYDAVLADPQGRVAARYGAERPVLVLVRPDRYVAAATDPRDSLTLDGTLARTFTEA